MVGKVKVDREVKKWRNGVLHLFRKWNLYYNIGG